MTLALIFVGGQADTTAPVLSSPQGAQTGPSTYSGSVDTVNDANGDLYYWPTQNARESDPDIEANGDTQAVIAEGTQNVSGAGLTGGTTYYLHYFHIDAAGNRSNVESSAAFTTDAGVGGTPNTKKAKRRREIEEEVRKASQAALLRRRRREELEAQRKQALDQANVDNIDKSLKKVFTIDAEIEELYNEMIQEEITRKKRRKRDKVAVMLLIN